MTANPNFPLVATQISTADPFDPAATPVWVPIGDTRVLDFNAAVGRQYESDLVQAGEATFDLWDVDEAFNTSNPASPFYPNLDSERQIIDQAMWPPAPVGAAVNLLNAGSGIDPSFESYALASTPSWVLKVGGVTPVITNVTPQQGSLALTWNVTNGGGQQGSGVGFQAIPGQVYTASAWVRQTAANTQQLSIAGHAAMATTAVSGAYVQLSGTFTADQPYLQLLVTTPGATANGGVTIDAIQIEPGNTVHAFSTTGPVIYSDWNGFIERIEKSWEDGGVRGLAHLTCVDALAILAGQFLQAEYDNSVLAKKPDFYWKLDEPQGATSFAETSGNGGPPLRPLNSEFGPGPVFAAGTQTNIAGDPSGTGLSSNTGAVAANVPATVAQTGVQQTSPTVPIGVSNPGAWSVAFWMSHTTLNALGGNAEFGALLANPVSTILQLTGTDGAPNILELVSTWPGGAGDIILTDTWADGKPHLFVGTVSIAGITGTLTWYIDGVQVGTQSAAATASFTPNSATYVQIGGRVGAAHLAGSPAIAGGVYSKVALWSRALSAGEVTDLWNAGKGYPGEGAGARLQRYVSYNWIGPTAIDAGSSVMDVSTLAADTSVLDACQQGPGLTENGVLYVGHTGAVAPPGAVTFAGRNRRYLNTTATWVLGEQELPYEEDIGYSTDSQQVFNDVQITRSGGIIAVGGTQAAQTASRKRHGKKTLTRTVNGNSDLETQDYANFFFAGHSQSTQRLSGFTIRPSANPALWPMALGAKQGDRITVKRRTSAGYVMNSDFFIERIEHNRMVTDNGPEWTVNYQASPAALTRQPWILGDSTYGQLGSTTVLGF